RDAPHARVLDARDSTYYTGAAQANRSAGHIPGARSLPFTSFHDDNNVWLSKAAIEQKFRAAGVEPGDTVVAYCHVGQQATVVIVAAQLTGHPARLYDGSFQDWTMRKLPTEGGH
ncbi:MAG: sulfurtransferase, partial [Gemmatimonadales bacterium]